MTSSDLYRREAQRLYTLADALPLGQVRNEFIEIARRYEALARHAEAMESRTTAKLPDEIALVPVRFAPER